MKCGNKELARLSDLIGLIYEGATAPSRWSKDILPAVAGYIQMPECLLYTVLHYPQNGGYKFFNGITQEWFASKAFNECFNRDPNIAQLASKVVFGGDPSLSMPVTCSSVRDLHHPDSGNQIRARMQLVLPHLFCSLEAMQRLHFAEHTVATTLTAIDRLSLGVLLLDEKGAVAFANRSARRILDDGAGLRLRKPAHSGKLGHLTAEDAAASEAIGAAISASLTRDPYAPHSSSCVTVPRTSDAASYTLQFSALGDRNKIGEDSGVYAAIAFIADGAQEVEIDPALLQNAYGLTPAEAKVAAALIECSTAEQVATQLGTSPNTVRTQIKQIYAKLGVDTRARFVKLMMAWRAIVPENQTTRK